MIVRSVRRQANWPYPFDPNSLFQVGLKLTDILKRQCELSYHLHMPLSDIEDCNVGELKWIHDWLVQQKRDEQEQLEKQLKNGNK